MMDERTVGARYSAEELFVGDLVMWSPVNYEEADSHKWIGMITKIFDKDDDRPIKCVMWFDGDIHTCDSWGEGSDALHYMYLGRLPNNLHDYLNPPSKQKKKKG